MRKADLIERTGRRTSERYGVEFGVALFEDLQKDGLIETSDRNGNSGRRPRYPQTPEQYRRALQIARFRRWGYVGRGALRLRLFLADYSVPASHAREATNTEYRRHISSLMSPVRSAYVDNNKRVPLKHKQALLESFGDLDPRLAGAGLGLDDDRYVDAVRVSRQKPLCDKAPAGFAKTLHGCLVRPFSFAPLASAAISLTSGLLNLRARGDDIRPTADSIEGLILSADDAAFDRARQLWRVVYSRHGLLRDIFSRLLGRAGAEAWDAVHFSSHRDPRWTVATFVTCLFISVRFHEVSAMMIEAASLPGARRNRLFRFLPAVGGPRTRGGAARFEC